MQLGDITASLVGATGCDFPIWTRKVAVLSDHSSPVWVSQGRNSDWQGNANAGLVHQCMRLYIQHQTLQQQGPRLAGTKGPCHSWFQRYLKGTEIICWERRRKKRRNRGRWREKTLHLHPSLAVVLNLLEILFLKTPLKQGFALGTVELRYNSPAKSCFLFFFLYVSSCPRFLPACTAAYVSQTSDLPWDDSFLWHSASLFFFYT